MYVLAGCPKVIQGSSCLPYSSNQICGKDVSYLCILEPRLVTVDNFVRFMKWFQVQVSPKDDQVSFCFPTVCKSYQLLGLLLPLVLVHVLALVVDGVPDQVGHDGVDFEVVKLQSNPASQVVPE